MSIWMLALLVGMIVARGMPAQDQCSDVALKDLPLSPQHEDKLAQSRTDHHLARLESAESTLRSLAAEIEGAERLNEGALAMVLARLAGVRYDRGDYADAERLSRRSSGLFRSSLGQDHGLYGASLGLLATTLCGLGHCAEAERLAQEGLTIISRACGESNTQYGTALGLLSGILYERGEIARAIPVARRAVSLLEGVPDAEMELAHGYHRLSTLLYHDKTFNSAEEYLVRCRAILQRRLPPDHVLWLPVLNSAISIAVARRRYDEAIGYVEPMLRIAIRMLGPEHGDFAALLGNVGSAYAAAGKYSEAAEKFSQAIAVPAVSSHPDYVLILTRYSEVLGKLHRKKDARLIQHQVQSFVRTSR